MREKTMDISTVKTARENIPDLKVYGNGDTFRLLCKASSQEEGWMKSTKVCNVYNGCIVQVTTQQRNIDGSYAVAEALTFVPSCHIDTESDPRRIVPIKEYETQVWMSKSEYEELKKYKELIESEEEDKAYIEKTYEYEL